MCMSISVYESVFLRNNRNKCNIRLRIKDCGVTTSVTDCNSNGDAPVTLIK